MSLFRLRSGALLFTALLLVGCPDAGGDSSGKKDKSGDSASAKAKDSKAKSKASGKEVAASSGDRMPIAVGQWTRHKIKTKAGDGTVTYSITGEEAGAHWLHFEYEVASTKLTSDVLVDFGDLKDLRNADIRKAKVKLPTGQEQVVEGVLLNQMKDKFADALGPMTGALDDKAPREDMTVPAGTFRGCFKSEGKFTVAGVTSESTSWNHTAVPLAALVRLETKDGSVWELESYGLKGGPK